MANKNIKDISELEGYQKHYSESELWTKIKKVAKKAGEKVIWYVLLLYYTLQSPEVPVQSKAIIIGALGYFILPVDLIPDLIPVLGFTDDAAALMMAYKAVQNNVTPEIESKTRQKLQEWFA